jgi:penicillin G amidase
MKPEVAKRLRLLTSALSVLLLLSVLLAAWFFWRVQVSLPQLDGTVRVAGLGAEVTVERDALGVPTIRAQNRVDAARTLGWLHGQDRFFQMDLMRRSAAGELAAVFGKRALPRDRATRMHGFRKLAEQVVAQLSAAERAVVEAYATGVNAGLGALRERPFEYLVQREQPQPWQPADSVLVVYAMTLDLQDETGRYEQTLMVLRDQLGTEALDFFNPLVQPNDAALDGTTKPLPPIPGPKILDLRTKKVGAVRPYFSTREDATDPFPFPPRDPETVLGSNAFALAGGHTATGAAMVANDMHLDLAVPNIWYRASLEFEGKKITGVSLPGTPAIVAGSNGNIAWGFTNSYADVGDLVVVETVAGLPGWYNAPGEREGLKIQLRRETLRVKGEDDVTEEYRWTIWGPIVGENDRGQPLAHKWIAHDPAATNFALLGLESAQNVTEAVAVAHRAGMPAQNLVVADRAGDVAWTIAGKLPKRVGYDGRLPVSWMFGDRRWDGFVPPEEVPVMTSKAGAAGATPSTAALPDGRIWSGNQRHVGGDALQKLGDGDYARPARAAQIRDRLAPLERATPRDLLAIQLDDRALFLAPWHALLMETLTPQVTAEKKARANLRGFAEKWEGRASVDAVSYRLVREWRIAVFARIYQSIFASCTEAFPRFAVSDLQLEPATWALLREKPPHLLDPKFPTWDALLVAAADDVITQLDRQGRTLPQANWGWRNSARIRHPFGYSLPGWLAATLNMPADPLPGGDDMPRAQTPAHGASERLVVSPGHEADGIFHMPGGQSAHPRSPFFRAGHTAWVRGEPTPFLPGKTQHSLRLTP